jgi:hypothetical protein
MMNRTKRRVLGVISIVPAAGLLLLWLCSYGADCHLGSDGGRVYFFCVAGGSELNSYFGRINHYNPKASDVWTRLEQGPLHTEIRNIDLLGVHYISHGATSSPAFKGLSVPYPHLFVLSLVPVWLYVRHLRPRVALGARPCPVCNYDLRATPDRCPECGAIPAKT